MWVRKAPLPTPAFGLGLAVFDCAVLCRLVAAGGFAAGGFTAAAFVYNPRSDSWRSLPPLPAPRFGPSLLARPLAPTLYALGGYSLRLPAAGARRLHLQVLEYSIPVV